MSTLNNYFKSGEPPLERRTRTLGRFEPRAKASIRLEMTETWVQACAAAFERKPPRITEEDIEKSGNG